jgi:hypothetical protein
MLFGLGDDLTVSWAPGPLRPPIPDGEVHVWRAWLDRHGWIDQSALPDAERRRAEEIQIEGRRERWVAARGALRMTLARYMRQDPVGLALVTDDGGKPRIACSSAVRFNLSHSDGLALIAIATLRDVGVDLERTKPGRPDGYYRDWVRREATVKCTGAGLGGPPPQEPIWVFDLDPGPGWIAAIALRGEGELRQRRFELDPG